MIESDYSKCIKYHVVLSSFSLVSGITHDLFIDNILSSIGGCSDSGSIILDNELAASVIDTFIQHEDRLDVRERINNKQNNDKMCHNRIIDAKNVSTGLYFKNGEVIVGKSALDGLKDMKHLRRKADDKKQNE